MIQIFFRPQTYKHNIWTPQPITLPRSRCVCGVTTCICCAVFFTQGDERLFPTKNRVNTILAISVIGRLVQVTAECFNDVAIFWCTSEMEFLIWDIWTRTSSSLSFAFHSHFVGTTVTRTLNTSSIVGQV